jgi:hypothetical protein
MQILPNLYDFLFQHRQTRSGDYRIGQVCIINQPFTKEFSAQVQIMGRIYETAKQVIVWLGARPGPRLFSPHVEKLTSTLLSDDSDLLLGEEANLAYMKSRSTGSGKFGSSRRIVWRNNLLSAWESMIFSTKTLISIIDSFEGPGDDLKDMISIFQTLKNISNRLWVSISSLKVPLKRVDD